MKKIGIFGKLSDSEQNNSLIYRTFEILNKNKCKIFVHKEFYICLERKLFFKPIITGFFEDIKLNELDVIISIGGDGTFLECVAEIKKTPVPIIGINTGRLGFLASISKEMIETSLKDIITEKFTIEERSLLEVKIEDMNIDKIFPYALNELVIQKKDTSSMITIDAYVDNHFLNTYWGDGLIIATPTGSTAYSLSTGGPIIVPGSENIVITPIAPHTLTVRPIVLPDNAEIKLRVKGRGEKFLAAIDARNITIEHDTQLFVKKANFTIKMIKLPSYNYFATLRKKLMWGLDIRN